MDADLDAQFRNAVDLDHSITAASNTDSPAMNKHPPDKTQNSHPACPVYPPATRYPRAHPIPCGTRRSCSRGPGGRC